MNWFRQHFGLDFIDIAIQTVLTGLAMGYIDSRMHGPEADGLLMGTAAVSIVILAVRRTLALRRAAREPAGLTTGEMGATRLEELEQRVAQLEATEARVAELEERLDFTERMLAQSTGEKVSLPASDRP